LKSTTTVRWNHRARPRLGALPRPSHEWFAALKNLAALARLNTVDKKQSPRGLPDESNDFDILISRLKRIIETPGISDRDRKLVQRNLARIVHALEDRTKS
jgi:hypothetical protein